MSSIGTPPVDPSSEEDVRAEIEEILADGSVPFAEKEARLEELATRLGVSIDEAPAGDPSAADPLRMQIFNALGLVAEGGHSYQPQDDEPDASR